ncbi:hypothetical protein [Frankia sp. Cr1]|uniref:hypothetical protein n=1 Tax=Frankia sp. Cr1 TaxID=3073931 RepID=UPI002AD27FCC|nr:hypothetical protein [Frankia sp. Cr1]
MEQPRHRIDGLLSRRTARRVIRPHALLMADVVYAAWDTWVDFGQKAPDVRMKLRSLGRAVDVYEFMGFEIANRFDKVRGCEVTNEDGQTVLTFGGGELKASFNKIDLGGVSKPTTARQLRIFSQADLQEEVLPSMPRVTWARCGYVLDPTETQIARAVLHCTIDGKTAWTIDLPSRAVKPITPPAPLPTPLVMPIVPLPKIASASVSAPMEKPSAAPS